MESIQERQLVLAESFANKLNEVLANQSALAKTTEGLQRQNNELKLALERAQSNGQNSHKGNTKRRSTGVHVPDLLRASNSHFFNDLKSLI